MRPPLVDGVLPQPIVSQACVSWRARSGITSVRDARRQDEGKDRMQHVWKGFVIGAVAGAAVGLVVELLERSAEAASDLADEAARAARDLRAEAERRAPEIKEAARSAAATVAERGGVVAERGTARARAAGAAVGEKASSAVSSAR
jgi:hypothetical protein